MQIILNTTEVHLFSEKSKRLGRRVGSDVRGLGWLPQFYSKLNMDWVAHNHIDSDKRYILLKIECK